MNLIFRLNPKTTESNEEILVKIARMTYGVVDCQLIQNGSFKEMHIEISRMSYQDVLDLGANLSDNNFML